MLNIRLATLSETYQPKRLDPSKMAAFAKQDGKPLGINNTMQMETNASPKQTKCESNGLIISDGNEFVKIQKAEKSLSPNQSSVSNRDELKDSSIVEKPKLELIEDGGHLDQLFRQIRKQKGYHEEEEGFEKAPLINRVNIPEAFTGTKQSKTSASLRSTGLLHHGYDNVNLYNEDLLENSFARETSVSTPQLRERVSSSIKSRSAEGSVKKVSFQDHVNTYNEQGLENVKPISVEGTDQVSITMDLNRNWQEINIPAVAKETSTTDARGHINYFEPLNHQPYTPFNRLNKLLPENKVPVDHHKHRSNPSIDVNNLASYDNDLNIIHRDNSGRQNSLYSLISSDKRSSACNSKDGLLVTNKAQFNRRNVGTSNSSDALISSGKNDVLFNVELNDRRRTFPYDTENTSSTRSSHDSSVEYPTFGLNTASSENSHSDPTKSRNKIVFNSARTVQDLLDDKEKQFSTPLESSFAGRLSSGGANGKDQPTSTALTDTSERLPSKILFTQPQEALLDTKTVIKDNQSLKPTTKSTRYDNNTETREPDLRKSYGLLSQTELTEIPTLSSNVIENQDILNRSLNYNLNMSNFHDSHIGRTTSEPATVSSLTKTRAFFEQQKGQQTYHAKQESIRKVGKLNIHQGHDARSSYAITERHGAAPSSMSIKMKKQLEDVLGRTPSLPTPTDSRKGSTIDIHNFPPQRSNSGNSQGSSQGTSLIDRVNSDISSMRITYERSDSGASEGSSRDSIKQELEVLFSGRGQNGASLTGKTSQDSKYSTTETLPSRYKDVDRESSTKSSPRFDSDMKLESNDVSPEVVEFKRSRLPQDLKSLFEKKQSNTLNVSMRPTPSTQNKKESLISKGEINQQTSYDKRSQPLADFKPNNHEDSSLNSKTLQEPIVTDIRISSDSLNIMDIKKTEMTPPVDDSRPAMQSNPKVGGVKKLNIPGLFLTSKGSEKSTSIPGQSFKGNKGNRFISSDIETPDKVTQGAVIQQKDFLISDNNIKSTVMDETLPREGHRENHEGSLSEISTTKISNHLFISSDSGTNSGTNQDVKKTEVETGDKSFAKPGKLNMGSFAMFGRNASGEGTRKMSNEKPQKSVDRSYNTLRKNYSEIAQQNSITEAKVQSESSSEPQISCSDLSPLMETKQNFLENQNTNTIGLEPNDKPGAVSNKHTVLPAKVDTERASQWAEPTFVSPVSNIRRGKVMIPGAFAVAKTDTSRKEPVNRMGFRASTSAVRGTVEEAKQKTVDGNSINSDIIGSDHPPVPVMNNVQPLNGGKSSSPDVTQSLETPLNLSLNGPKTDEGSTLEEQYRNPKRLAIPNIFSQTQNKVNQTPKRDVKPLHHVEERIMDQPTNGEPLYQTQKSVETKENEIATSYKKVGRLAIPNMFSNTSSSERKPGKVPRYGISKQRDAMVTKSNDDVIQPMLFHQTSKPDSSPQVSTQAFNHRPGATLNGSSLQELDASAESYAFPQNYHENTNREDEKGGFISPRRGNVNRNQFIGKISVPSVFQ